LEKKLKIRNKGNRKSNFVFWNFEDQNEWKNRGETKEIYRTNIIKEKKRFRKQKKEK
jgi:hemerythrin superfamily protein